MGVRMLVAAGLVGFLVLLLRGTAHAEEELDSAALERLAQPATASPAECLERAEGVLEQESYGRWMGLNEEILDAAWSTATSSSPSRALSEVRDVASELWSWRGRSLAENDALEWLELSGSAADEAMVGLHTELRAREIEATVEALLDATEESLSEPRARSEPRRVLARVRLARAMALQPDSERASELRALLEAPSLPTLQVAPAVDAAPLGMPTALDVDLSTALLLEDFDRVLGLAPPTDSGLLAASVAQYLDGSHAQALDQLEALAGRDSRAGEIAAEWIDREDINVERVLSRAVRSYRLRHGLGLLGGTDLATSGWDLSRDGYRAWQRSINPLNVVLAVPIRLVRGFKPRGDDVRAAAERYLIARPAGDRVPEARAWLETVGRGATRTDALGLLSLDLHKPSVQFQRLTPRPLLLTRAVLDSVFVSEALPLRVAMGQGSAVVLHAEVESEDEVLVSVPLEGAAATRLLSELELALEQARLTPVERSARDALATLYQLHEAVRNGARLVATPGSSELGEPEGAWLRMQRALTDGGTEVSGAFVMAREDDELHVSRFVGREAVMCPRDMLCVDHESRWSGNLYAKVDDDSSTRIGFKTRVDRAQMSFTVTESGPSAQLILPVARWFGVGRWLPVSAKVRISADSIYIGPHIEGQAED
jgi:hypothetical protein